MKQFRPISSPFYKKISFHILALLILFFPLSLLANNYLSVSTEKNGKYYSNEAVILDLENNNQINQIDLGKSYKYAGNFLNLKDEDKKYFYLPTSKKTAELKVFKRDTMALLYSYNLDPLDQFVLNLELKQFIKLSSDFSKLYIQTIQKKNRQILVIDNYTGKLINKVQLKKGKTISKLSLNGKYVISKNLSRKTVDVYNASNLEEITKIQLNSARKVVANFQDYLFTNITVEYRNKSAFKIEVLDLTTLKKSIFEFKSKSNPVYAKNEETGKFYIATSDLKSNFLKLNEFSAGELLPITVNALKIKPQSIMFHKDTDNMIIVGKGSIIEVNINNPENSVWIDKPFDTKSTIWSPLNDRLYLREGSGSEVAAINTKDGKLINRSGTGRPGVKFGQFLASAAFTVVAYNFGYIGYAYNLSNTLMVLDSKNDFLYVINAKTNDVTRFKASDLSSREAIATGSGTGWIYQDKSEDSKIFVISSKKVNFINNQQFSIDKEIKYKKFLGLDLDNKVTFIDTGSSIEAYSMLDGKLMKKLPLDKSSYIIAL